MLHVTDNHRISKNLGTFPGGTPRSNASPLEEEVSNLSGLAALSMEFVAKPQEAHRLQTLIPSSLKVALESETGFAGCLVMVSHQEARLMTVVTLWTGEKARERSAENARRVQKLLAPYIDRQLRVQFLSAFLPALPAKRSETLPLEEGSILQPLPLPGEEVCVS